VSPAVEWSRVRAVSWNVDGTLYDLAAVKRLLRRRALLRAWLPGTWREARVLRDFLRAMEAARRQGGDLRALRLGWPRAAMRAIEGGGLAEAIARAGPRAGARELLAALQARGLPQVVVSDHPAAEKLRALGLESAFAQVVEGEALGWIKPSPRPFLRAAELLGIAPDALLHRGDREDSDGVGARAAGCQVVVLGRDPLGLASLLGRLPAAPRGGAPPGLPPSPT
jgi:FMN phosphatase YigB (HAD superfamily)